MNLTLFLIGLWFLVFLISIVFFTIIFSDKQCKEYGVSIIFISIILSMSITFLTGGIIG